jgi:hypothetical protein
VNILSFVTDSCALGCILTPLRGWNLLVLFHRAPQK